jgi:hypothetical protein
MPLITMVLLSETALAQDDFSLTVDREHQRVELSTLGKQYQAYVHEGAFRLTIVGHSVNIRINAAEGANKSMDWYRVAITAIRSKRNTPKEKSAEILCKVIFSDQPFGPESRRAIARTEGKSRPQLNMQVRILVTIKKDQPCVFVEYKLINRMREAIIGYVLPWFGGHSDGFTFPIKESTETRKYAGKYMDVGNGDLPWIIVNQAEGKRLGVILPDYRKVYVGEYSGKKDSSGSIYLNHINRTFMLEPGQAMIIRSAFMPVDSVDQIAALAKTITTKPK